MYADLNTIQLNHTARREYATNDEVLITAELTDGISFPLFMSQSRVPPCNILLYVLIFIVHAPTSRLQLAATRCAYGAAQVSTVGFSSMRPEIIPYSNM